MSFEIVVTVSDTLAWLNVWCSRWQYQD